LCKQSEIDGSIVPYEDYIHVIPSDVGRQILLPTGTIHSSGRNQVVLELGTLTYSAYTYKIYDYTRMDITGKPRPLHTKLAKQALALERDAEWVMKHIAFPPRLLSEGQGWRELLIGQYECIYFETHRVEMETGSVYPGENRDGFTVITIVDGESARIQSIDDPSCYYDARYLDVILVPASMRRYEVIVTGKQPVVLHKAFVREDKFAS
jgi:mannose-6-phosphate isomerase class I